MALITLTELKAEATARSIDLTAYSDALLQKKIDWAIAYIQNGSNRVFTDTTYTQTSTDHQGDCIFLTALPVKSITTFTIDDVSVPVDNYTLNKSTGVIELTTEPLGEYSYMVTYVVCEDDQDIITVASEICADLVFVKIQSPADGQIITGLRSGDTQINYKQDDQMADINKKIGGIRQNNIFVGVI